MTDAEVAQITDNSYKADFPPLAAKPRGSLSTALLSASPHTGVQSQTMNANALRGLYRWSVEATAAIEGVSVLRLQSSLALSIETASQKASRLSYAQHFWKRLIWLFQALGRYTLKPGGYVVISIMNTTPISSHGSRFVSYSVLILVYLRMNSQYQITPEEIMSGLPSVLSLSRTSPTYCTRMTSKPLPNASHYGRLHGCRRRLIRTSHPY